MIKPLLKSAILIYTLMIICVMLGYFWCYTHQEIERIGIQRVYPDIAIDLTKPKHLTSWKYKTKRY